MPRKSINNKHHRPCRSVDALKMFNESENEMNGEEGGGVRVFVRKREKIN